MVFRSRGARFLPWTTTYLMIVGLMLPPAMQGNFQPLLEPSILLRFLGTLLALPCLSFLIFSRRLRIDDDGVRLSALYFAREWKWTDVTSVTYKPWSISQGSKNPTWIILEGPRGRLAFSSHLKKFDEVEEELARHLARSRLDFEAIKNAAIDDAVLGAPSWEDVPSVLLGVTWLVCAIGYSIAVLGCLQRPC